MGGLNLGTDTWGLWLGTTRRLQQGVKSGHLLLVSEDCEGAQGVGPDHLAWQRIAQSDDAVDHFGSQLKQPEDLCHVGTAHAETTGQNGTGSDLTCVKKGLPFLRNRHWVAVLLQLSWHCFYEQIGQSPSEVAGEEGIARPTATLGAQSQRSH